MKECGKCKETKELIMFNKHKNTKDKLHIHCKKCVSDYHKNYRSDNKEKLSKLSKDKYLNNSEVMKKKTNDHYHKNVDSIKVSRKIYRQNNVEKLREVNRIYGLENKDKIKARKELSKDQIKKTTKLYHKNNADLVNSICAKRRAAKLQATPKWLSKEDFKEIRAFYTEAIRLFKLDGIKRHVDHIIPLQGKLVCGFHVPWNLRVITATENLQKGNRTQIKRIY